MGRRTKNTAPSGRVGKSNRRNRKYIRRRKSASAQQRQLLTMSRNISRLNRAVGLTKQHAQYSQNQSGMIGYNIDNGPSGINPPSWVSKGWNIYEFITPNDLNIPMAGGPSMPKWSPVFQATNEVANANKFYLERSIFKLGFQMGHLMVQTGQGVEGQYQKIPALPREITIFVVSFKRDAFQQAKADFFNQGGYWDGTVWNSLNLSQYWKTTLGFINQQEALPMLNPAVFNIHKYKRFRLGQVTTEVNHQPGVPGNPVEYVANATSNLRDNYRTIEFSIAGSGLIKSVKGNKKWSELAANELPYNDRKFLLVHVSGNAHQDGTSNTGTQTQVTMTMNVLHTGKGTN